ncbi:cilia- and flagella-associated protein 58-like [Daktulosphaira vitifoliae]|uniref:cilia- and flagella-associated protein 58-like n=1 Tax=Daktulosphaira vitifoliae TaxID=58002 RepID=UPI0021AADA7D|nr:cilia- and flagella-associated protein 58-like [Daktulosphaira vitifoliae]
MICFQKTFKRSTTEKAFKFTSELQLTDTLTCLWSGIQSLLEKSVKHIDEKHFTSQMDNYRKIMTDIKQSIISEQNLIDQLEEKVKSANHMIDSLNLREQIIQESNDNLLAQIKTLKNELNAKTKQIEEEGLFSSMSQGDTCQLELMRTKRELTKFDDENKRLDDLCQHLKSELDTAEYNIRELEADITAKSNQLVKETKLKEKLEEQLHTNNEEMEKIKSELNSTKNNLKKTEIDLEKNNDTLKQLKIQNNQLNAKNISYDKKIKKFNKELKIKTELRVINGKDICHLKDKITSQETQLLKVQSELNSLTATHETSERKRQESVKEVEKFLKYRKIQENNVFSLEKKISQLQWDNNKINHTLEVTQRDKKLLEKSIAKMKEQMTTYLENLNLKNTAIKALELENTELIKSIDLLNQDKVNLEKNKEKLNQYVVTLKKKNLEVTAIMNYKEIEVQELKKEINVRQEKLKEFEHDLLSIKNEKNVYHKNTLEAKDDVEEMKEKFKMVSQQLEQQKEYVAYKEMQLAKNDTKLKQTEKELQKCQQEINKFELKFDKMSELLKKKNEDAKSLSTTLKTQQKKLEKLQNQIEQVNSDKSNLINHINIRNEELIKQKDANDVLIITLGKGEAEYQNRIEDIKLLKSHVKRLSSQKRLLISHSSTVHDLRRKLLKYEQKLNKERMKCRALEETLMKPTNIHPWRLLKNTNPSAFKMTVKIRILQKRLLEQCTRIFDKELQVKDIQSKYDKLKNEFVNLPSVDIFKEMNNIKRTLIKKNEKIKNLSSALTASEQLIMEIKFDLEKTKQDLDEFKNKYYELKKIQEKFKEKVQKVQVSAKSNPERSLVNYNRYLHFSI